MKRLFPLLLVVFFISGVAGLVYEIVWTKYLALFLGASSYSQLLVLATFMGGLALGAWRLGGLADRMRRPLLGYIWLELGIALWGLFFPLLFPVVRFAFLKLAVAFNLHLALIFPLKVLVCAALILIPATLMGGTLPVMARVVSPCLAAVGRNVSSLYYVNSFGAAVGCLLAGFWLIPALGLHWTNWLAAGLNLLAALLAIGVQRQLTAAPAAKLGAEVSVGEALADKPQESYRARRLALRVIAISGALAMLYEVAWIRLLTLSMGSSTYSFSLMLAAFISGIALGSYLLSFKRTARGYFFTLGVCEIAIGALVLLSMPLYQQAPVIFHKWASMLSRTPPAFPLYQAIKFALCFLVMAPPAMFFGMTLPAASHVVGDEFKILGRNVGGVFAVNTLGTIVGTVATGLILLPYLGLQGTLLLGIAGNFALGLIVLHACEAGPWVRRVRFAGWCVIIFGGLGYAPVGMLWSTALLNSGLYRRHGLITENQPATPASRAPKPVRPAFCADQGPNPGESVRRPGELKLLYHRDGACATVVVFADPRRAGQLFLNVNGKTDASTSNDLSTQLLLGHLPLLIHKRAKSAMLVGVGSGITMGAMLRHRETLETFDVLEISPEVVAAAEDCFSAFNNGCLRDRQANDSHARLYIEDAKTFLQITPRTYDVIVSEPSNPWTAGGAGLFTDQFFRQCADRLTTDGLLVQWVQGYEFEDETVRLIFDTLQETFPHVVLWAPNQADMVLIASRQPIEPDFARMARRLAGEKVNADLARIGIRSLQTLLLQQMGTLPLPDEESKKRPRNTDYMNRLEYLAPLGFFLGRQPPLVRELDARFDPRRQEALWIGQYRPAQPPSAAEFRELYCRIHNRRMLPPELARVWTRLWTRAWPEDEAGITAAICEEGAGPREQRRLFEERLIPQSTTPEVWRTYGEVLHAQRKLNRGVLLERRDDGYESALRRCLELGLAPTWRYHARLTEYFLQNGRGREAVRAAREGLKALTEDGDEALREQFLELLEQASELKRTEPPPPPPPPLLPPVE